MPADLPRVVIVGGGCGGLYATRALAEMSRIALAHDRALFGQVKWMHS